MTQEEIINGNKLMAEFFGNKTKDRVYKWEVFNDQWAAEGLKFHHSWDWLMPVVEKIESLTECDEFRIETNQIVARADKFYKIIMFGDVFHAEFKTKIEAVWNAVVQFILWYNKPNPL